MKLGTYFYKVDNIWHLLQNLYKQLDHTEQDDKVFGHSAWRKIKNSELEVKNQKRDEKALKRK